MARSSARRRHSRTSAIGRFGPTHADNAEANQTGRVFFRNGAGGAATQDGPGGENEGFYFDNITYGVYNNANGTGNGLNNVITGNSGDNTLSGLRRFTQ